MKTRNYSLAVPLAAALAFAALSPALHRVVPVARAQQYGALERGYRTGYSDGYQAGWGDQLRRVGADHSGKADYRQADRAYIPAYGRLEDYRDGYQQGYEVGYDAGYRREGFDSNLPAEGVARRGATPRESAGDVSQSDVRSGQTPADGDYAPGGSGDESASGGALGPIPANTVMTVELLNRLSTDVSQRGDRFEARVIEPREYEGTVVAGRLTDVQRPGKTRGRALLQLSFDQVKLPEGGWAGFGAQVVEVIAFDNSTALEVDPEGGIRGKDSTRDDVAKVGAGAGVGAIIGGIAGGGKGAGIGAVIGAGAGTARVMTERGKEIRFEPGQQLRIRSTGRAR